MSKTDQQGEEQVYFPQKAVSQAVSSNLVYGESIAGHVPLSVFTRGLRKHGSTLHSWGKPQVVYCSVCLGSVLERMSILSHWKIWASGTKPVPVFLLQVEGA